MHVALFPSTSGRVYRPEEPIFIAPVARITANGGYFPYGGGRRKGSINVTFQFQFIWNDGASQCLENLILYYLA